MDYGGFFQFGLPGETLDTISQTIEKIKKYKLTYTKSVIIHNPLYGTYFNHLAKRQYAWIGRNWNDITAVRGLVYNNMTPSKLISLIEFLRKRSVFS